jgi:Bacterial regulatory proteins, luxR family
VGHEEACRLYRLSDIRALATINSGAKTPVIEFYPKARRFARIAGWYFKQANFVYSDFINHDMTSAVVFGVEIQLRTGFRNTRSNHFCLSVLKVASAPALARPLVSPRTVEIYRANVMTKISANSLSDLVRMAITAGILTNKSES